MLLQGECEGPTLISCTAYLQRTTSSFLPFTICPVTGSACAAIPLRAKAPAPQPLRCPWLSASLRASLPHRRAKSSGATIGSGVLTPVGAKKNQLIA